MGARVVEHVQDCETESAIDGEGIKCQNVAGRKMQCLKHRDKVMKSCSLCKLVQHTW
jgi:hypothetical protein